MTVKQLRDWLIKQDETAVLAIVDADRGWDYNFDLRAVSSVNTVWFEEKAEAKS